MWVKGVLRQFCATICGAIYHLIALLYELFINISRATILSSDDIKVIYSRITLILAIVMTFYVTFEFVKYVVQPDTIGDKEKGAGNLVFKMVIVVLLIAFVPTIFSLGYKLQNVIFDQQVFSKVILGKVNVDQEKFGKDFAMNIFTTFYRFDEEKWGKEADAFNCDDIPCGSLINENISGFRENGSFPAISLGLSDDSSEDLKTGKIGEEETPEFYITFDGLFAIAVGLFVAYMLLMYCVDAGVRVVQLAFLQIIAPIPIIGYLSPKKDNMFSKWGKQCITTYLDLFFRLGIIHIVVLIIQILANAYENDTLVGNLPLTSGMKNAVYIFLILGLLLFAHKAPKMLQELFPKMGAAAGNFGLKAGERGIQYFGAALGGAVAGAAGAFAGITRGAYQTYKGARANQHGRFQSAVRAVGGSAMGSIRGAVGGVTRGVYNGAKGKKLTDLYTNTVKGVKNENKSMATWGNQRENGHTIGTTMEDFGRSIVPGIKPKVEALQEQSNDYKKHDEILNKAKETEKKVEERAIDKILHDGKTSRAGGPVGQARNEAYAAFRSAEKHYAEIKGRDESAYRGYSVTKLLSSLASTNGAVGNEMTTEERTTFEALCSRVSSGTPPLNATEQVQYETLKDKAIKDIMKQDVEKAAKDYKETKDAAVEAYAADSAADSGFDHAITQMFAQLGADIKGYNMGKHPDEELAAAIEDGGAIANGGSDYATFRSFVKQGHIQQQLDQNSTAESELNARITREQEKRSTEKKSS